MNTDEPSQVPSHVSNHFAHLSPSSCRCVEPPLSSIVSQRKRKFAQLLFEKVSQTGHCKKEAALSSFFFKGVSQALEKGAGPGHFKDWIPQDRSKILASFCDCRMGADIRRMCLCLSVCACVRLPLCVSVSLCSRFVCTHVFMYACIQLFQSRGAQFLATLFLLHVQ